MSLIADLAERVAALPQPWRVAVDGVSAAGKTTFADALAQQLPVPVLRRSIDDFHRAPPQEYYPDSFDLERLRSHLESLRENVVVDGVFLHHPRLRDLWHLSVFLRVDRDVALARALARDHGWMDDAEARYATRYVPGETRYLDEVGPEALADVVVENTDPTAPRLGRAAT